MAGSDFFDVQLSPAGQKLAGAGGKIRIIAQHMDYTFTASGSTRVLTSEWRKTLSKKAMNGEILLQLVPAQVTQIPVAANPVQETAAVKPEDAAPESQSAETTNLKSTKGGK